MSKPTIDSTASEPTNEPSTPDNGSEKPQGAVPSEPLAARKTKAKMSPASVHPDPETVSLDDGVALIEIIQVGNSAARQILLERMIKERKGMRDHFAPALAEIQQARTVASKLFDVYGQLEPGEAPITDDTPPARIVKMLGDVLGQQHETILAADAVNVGFLQLAHVISNQPLPENLGEPNTWTRRLMARLAAQPSHPSVFAAHKVLVGGVGVPWWTTPQNPPLRCRPTLRPRCRWSRRRRRSWRRTPLCLARFRVAPCVTTTPWCRDCPGRRSTSVGPTASARRVTTEGGEHERESP